MGTRANGGDEGATTTPEPQAGAIPNADCVLTIFSIPKPFDELAAIHQQNAIASWLRLGPRVQLVLFTDSEVPQAIADRVDIQPITAVNTQGTPLLDDVFHRAGQVARGRYLMYSNADILLDHRLLNAVDQLDRLPWGRWLAIGRRIDIEQDDFIESEGPASDVRAGSDQGLNPAGGSDHRWREWWEEAEAAGRLAPIVCKDYFIFPAGMYRDIPPFAVGRGNWDNWMVWRAKQNGIPVIDLTEIAPVLHPNHAHRHVSGGRWGSYVGGEEARENQRLAGGRHLVSGSTADWKMKDGEVQRVPCPWIRFWCDLPRFLSLMRNLLFFKYIS